MKLEDHNQDLQKVFQFHQNPIYLLLALNKTMRKFASISPKQ